MSKIMVLGDTHGSADEAILAVQNAAVLDIDTIVQCGDFGLWPGKRGMNYLDNLNAALIDSNIMLIWVDGNHEDFDQLERYCATNPKNKWGQVFLRSNILYSPRGTKFRLKHKNFMTVGGAVSIDKMYRTKGESWWPQEQLTDEQLDAIVTEQNITNTKVDYLFTHDCPTNAPFNGRFKDDRESVIHRQRMDRLGKAVKPGMWFHGHMHTKFDGYDFPAYEPTTTVYGLECDGMLWNWGVLDTEADTFEWGHDILPYDYAPAEWDGDYVLLPE